MPFSPRLPRAHGAQVVKGARHVLRDVVARHALRFGRRLREQLRQQRGQPQGGTRPLLRALRRGRRREARDRPSDGRRRRRVGRPRWRLAERLLLPLHRALRLGLHRPLGLGEHLQVEAGLPPVAARLLVHHVLPQPRIGLLREPLVGARACGDLLGRASGPRAQVVPVPPRVPLAAEVTERVQPLPRRLARVHAKLQLRTHHRLAPPVRGQDQLLVDWVVGLAVVLGRRHQLQDRIKPVRQHAVVVQGPLPAPSVGRHVSPTPKSVGWLHRPLFGTQQAPCSGCARQTGEPSHKCECVTPLYH